MKSFSFTIHTAFDFEGKTLCTPAKKQQERCVCHLYEKWGLLSASEIEEGEEEGEDLTEWPCACWVEASFSKELQELALARRIDCLSWDDIGMAFESVAKAREAIKVVMDTVLDFEEEGEDA